MSTREFQNAMLDLLYSARQLCASIPEVSDKTSWREMADFLEAECPIDQPLMTKRNDVIELARRLAYISTMAAEEEAARVAREAMPDSAVESLPQRVWYGPRRREVE